MFVQCIVQTQNENKHRQKPRKKRQRRPQIEQLPNEYNECNDCLLVVSLGAFHLGEQRQKKKKKPNEQENRTEHHVYFSALPTCDFPQLVFL